MKFIRLKSGDVKQVYTRAKNNVGRNINNYYANKHALLRDSRSKKTKIIIADLTCIKKTYPLNFWRELEPNSSL